MAQNLRSKIGTIAVAGAMGLSSIAGCVPKPISESNNGDSFSYVSTDKGEAYQLKEGASPDSSANLTAVICDSDSGVSRRRYEIEENNPQGLTNTDESLAYSYEVDGPDWWNSNIVFYNDGRKKEIEDAAFPALSEEYLAYASGEHECIVIDHYNDGKLEKTGVPGLPLSFSPDSEYLLFVSNSTDKSGADSLSTYDLSSGRVNDLIKEDSRYGKLGGAKEDVYPSWCGDDEIIFYYTPKGEDTPEVCIIDADDGSLTRVTDNHRLEVSADMSSNGDVFYVSRDSDGTFEDYHIHYCSNNSGFWTEHRAGDFKASWLKVVGEKGDEYIVYGKDNGQVYRVSLEDLVEGDTSEAESVSDRVETSINAKKLLRNLFM